MPAHRRSVRSRRASALVAIARWPLESINPVVWIDVPPSRYVICIKPSATSHRPAPTSPFPIGCFSGVFSTPALLREQRSSGYIIVLAAGSPSAGVGSHHPGQLRPGMAAVERWTRSSATQNAGPPAPSWRSRYRCTNRLRYSRPFRSGKAIRNSVRRCGLQPALQNPRPRRRAPSAEETAKVVGAPRVTGYTSWPLLRATRRRDRVSRRCFIRRPPADPLPSPLVASCNCDVDGNQPVALDL